MKAENEILTNGLDLIVDGISIGDGLADSLPEMVVKYNNNLPLLLTVNDRSLPNTDQPFTFEGELHVLDKVLSETLSTNTAEIKELFVEQDGSISGSLTINGDLNIQGSVDIGGDISLNGSLSLNNISVRNELSLESLSSNNDQGIINLKGSRLVNSYQIPLEAYEVANKQYVDQRVSGFKFFNSCRVTDANTPLSNQSISEEKDMNNNYLGRLYALGSLSIDGVDLEQSDRVLIVSYRDDLAYRNGIYKVLNPGRDEIDWVIERDSDFQVAENMNQSDLVFVREGTEQVIYWFIREFPFTPEDVFSRPVYFTPYRANVNLFDGGEIDFDQRLSSLENNLLQEISRLENAVARSQKMVLPSHIEMPVGSVIYSLSENLDQQNSTFLKLDGSRYLQSEYSELYNIIGNTYDHPEEDINGQFRVPDFQNRMIMSSSDKIPLGQTRGVDSYTLRTSQLPDSNLTIYSQSHNHDLEVWREDPNGDTDISEIDSSAPIVSDYWGDHLSPNGRLFQKVNLQTIGAQSNLSSSTLGNNNSISNLPPYFACNSYIKAKRSLVRQELPTIIWFSFNSDYVSYTQSSTNRSVEIYIQLDNTELPQIFLDQVKLEVLNESNNTVLYKTFLTESNNFDDKTPVLVQNLDPGDNLLSIRLSEPTVPNTVWSTSIRYRRRIPEATTSPSFSDRVDRDCPFKLLSAYTTPVEVSSGDNFTYRTQAEGVYHIQTTIYYFPSNDSETEIFPGVVTGDISQPSCRQLLLIGDWVVPSTAVSGDLIGVEFKYWSPLNPSNDAYRVETLYLDVV